MLFKGRTYIWKRPSYKYKGKPTGYVSCVCVLTPYIGALIFATSTVNQTYYVTDTQNLRINRKNIYIPKHLLCLV